MAGARHYDLMAFGNGTLAGLVAITSPCSTVYPWAALIIGGVAGVLYCIGSEARYGMAFRALQHTRPWFNWMHASPCSARLFS